MVFDLKKVDNIEFDGVDPSDYPDFCNAFIASADYDGEEMTEDMLDEFNDKHLGDYYDEMYQTLID